MSKKTWTIILTCITVAALIALIPVCLQTWAGARALENLEVEEQLPGASILITMTAELGLWLGFGLRVFILSVVGFFAAFVNVRLTETLGEQRLHRVSRGFVFFWFAVIMALIVVPLVLMCL